MDYPDKLGCYRVGDLKFYSKLEAIEHMQRTGTHLHWDFNEAVFSSYDWTVEPKENILELYRQRAQQLRDKYDYIIIAFSGGADSRTVLDSFVNNDVHVDEVLSFFNYQAEADKDGWMSSEIFKTAAPTIDYLKETHPWIRHRIIDLVQLEIDYFSKDQNKFNWIYEVNMLYGPNNVSRESLALKIKDWADLIHAGKKLCIVWGKDKPRVHQIEGKFVARFIDFIDDAATVKSIAGQQPYTDELFYWTPDLPKISIKQAHLIKNYLSRDVANLPFVSLEKSDLACVESNGKKYWLNNHGVHSVIYPKWNINTFSCAKPPSSIYSNRDMWLFNLQQEHTVRKNWNVGLNKLWQMLPDYWKNNPKDIKDGLKGCWSKNYFLE